jgi:hypothetical protein
LPDSVSAHQVLANSLITHGRLEYAIFSFSISSSADINHLLSQANGANLTGGGTGGSAASGSASASFVPFNGAPLPLMPAGVWPAIILGCLGALLGAFGVVSRI